MAKEKILIVDDEPMIRWTLNEALRGWGYEPIEAGTVMGALASFESDHPAAILLDINLPDGSGLDALREIKNRQPQSVVIMITANVMVEDTLAALRGGAYDFIGKPINLGELQVTIRNGIEAMQDAEKKELIIKTGRVGDDHIFVTVQDIGPGLPGEIRSKLFQPFVTTKEGGMGVGLMICQSIIQLHGGSIEVSPETEPGTAFTFRLPLDEQLARPAAGENL